MDARWHIAAAGHEIVKGRGAHRRPEPQAEPTLAALVIREVRSAFKGLAR